MLVRSKTLQFETRSNYQRKRGFQSWLFERQPFVAFLITLRSKKGRALQTLTLYASWPCYKAVPHHLRLIEDVFGWHCSGLRIPTFTSENYSHENFDAIPIQRRISASIPIKMLWINLPKFASKEKAIPLFRLFLFQISITQLVD